MFFLAWLVPSIIKKTNSCAQFTISLLWPLLIWEKEVKQQKKLQQYPSAVLPRLPGGDRGPSRVSARFALLLEDPGGRGPAWERRCPTAVWSIVMGRTSCRERAGLGGWKRTKGLGRFQGKQRNNMDARGKPRVEESASCPHV